MFDGAHLASAILIIHAVEMEQAERCPDWRRSDRIERSIAIYARGNRAAYWLGRLMENIGRRLQEYGAPRTMTLGNLAMRQG